MARQYAVCLVIAFLTVVISAQGQYYHPNEHIKYYSIPSTDSSIPNSLQDVEAVARSTPFEFLVADILEAADGDLSNVLDFDLPQNVSQICRTDFNRFMLNVTDPYTLQSK